MTSSSKSKMVLLLISYLLLVSNISSQSSPPEKGFQISQWNGTAFEEMYNYHFQVKYSTKEFVFNAIDGKVSLRFEQSGLPFADIDEAKLVANGQELIPEYARYAGTGQNIIDDILEIDHDVIVASNKEIEILWEIPDGCEQTTLFLNANEYGHGIPFLFPLSGNAQYKMGSNKGSIVIDGNINETDGTKPVYSPYWKPATGHPEGYTYIYICDDPENVYFSLDLTGDNTDEYGEDWTEITVITSGGTEHVFRIDDFDNTWGRASFGHTSKVSYKHQSAEFCIPKDIIGNEDFEFNLKYYGTGAAVLPPVVEGVESTALIYTEGDGAVEVSGSIIVNFGDLNLESATVAISANYWSNQDILYFTNTGDITGTFNQSNGTLTLSGVANAEAYTNALRSVMYENTSDNPAGAMGKGETSQTNSEMNSLPRMITFYVSALHPFDEQVLNSGMVYRYITIVPVNDAPLISGMADNIEWVCGESVEMNIFGKVSDAETSDRQLTYEFTTSTNSVQTNLNTSTGKATVTASQGFSGSGTINVKVTDPEGAYAEHTIAFTVTCAPTGIESIDGIPKDYKLEQNYPNPFNPNTTISYALPKESFVRLIVYDMLGKQIAVLVDQYQNAGYHDITFDAAILNSGIYLYKLEAGSYTETKKMIFLK